MDRAQVAHAGDPANVASSGGKKKDTPAVAPLSDLPGVEPTVVVQENIQAAPEAGGGSKLKKGKGPATLSTEEEAMEDARKLAGKSTGPPGGICIDDQRSRRPQRKVLVSFRVHYNFQLMLAVEAAEKERIQKAKADKVKMAADRHQEQVTALANLQKALVSISHYPFGIRHQS